MNTFRVKYLITCFEGEDIDQKLRWICLEQSVELPEEVVSKAILNLVVGQVKEVEEQANGTYEAVIAWPLSNVGDDPTQFLNMLYGNISLKRGIKVLSVNWESLTSILQGPAFGIHGIRERVQIPERALACGVLKPMGLSSDELAELASSFSRGGIDLIKDDHGLADQRYAPFEDRIKKVLTALHQTEKETGKRAHYYPNITTTGSKLMEKYKRAADLGADGVMVIPELCGYESMHELARSDIDLPIIAHPAFSGNRVTDAEHGFSPAFLYGELYRAFGADYCVYPNTGGRFSFSPEACHALNNEARRMDSPFRPTFPMPGGGIKRETIKHWIKEYGNNTVILLGASMLQHPQGVEQAAAEVHELLGSGLN